MPIHPSQLEQALDAYVKEMVSHEMENQFAAPNSSDTGSFISQRRKNELIRDIIVAIEGVLEP